MTFEQTALHFNLTLTFPNAFSWSDRELEKLVCPYWEVGGAIRNVTTWWGDHHEVA